jgi:Photosynthesis system II assembly factor YCF48
MANDSARDKTIENLVSGKLHAQKNTPAAPCPDAEILAAYVERALAPRERELCETHFAECTRCQEHLAQVVKLGEADDETVAQAPARWKRVFGLRWAWAAPMLVAVLIGGIWYTGEIKNRLKQTSETGVEVSAPIPAPPKAPETSGREPNKPEAADTSRPERRLQDRKRLPRPTAARNEIAQEEAAGPVGGLATGRLGRTPQNAASSQVSVGGENREAEAPAPPAATKPDQPAAMPDMLAKSSEGKIAPPSERARLQAQSTDQLSQPKVVAAQAEAGLTSSEKSSAVEAGMAGGAQSRGETTAKSANNGNVLLKSQSLAGASNNPEFHYTNSPSRIGTGFFTVTSPQYLWRVGPRGLIQKQGLENKWETKSSGVDADLFDIKFPSADVGWVVGQKGTILRTSDGGNTWTKIASPTSDDLVRVTATGGRAAEVTTRSGLFFVTSNGGESWSASSHPQ